ncbi:MAG: alkaline phosphatase D family protein [Vicinamibacterales bacterium]
MSFESKRRAHPHRARRISRRRMLAESAAAPFALSSLVRAQTAASAAWVWTGAVTATSAIVKARIVGTPNDLHLQVDADEQLSRATRFPISASMSPPGSGLATFVADGLSPDTRYFYALADGDRRLIAGEFRTFAGRAMSFKFAAASCAGGNMFSSISNHQIFSIIEARKPLFMLHMGDMHYSNIGRNDIRAFRRAYDAVLTQPRQAALFRRTPIVYMWDDHDYGPDDSDRTSPARVASRRAYAETVPHYPLVLDNGNVTTIQQEFTGGRIRFIASDLRSERDPTPLPDGPNKSSLGAAQRERLFAAVQRAVDDGVPLVFWVSSVPWITRTGSPQDGWQPFAWERQAVSDRLDALGLTHRIVMLSGDAHMVAIDDGTNSNYASRARPGERGFAVLQASPLDRSPSIKGGPYSHGVSDINHQFGWVEVDDDGETVQVTLSGLDRSGRQIRGMRLQLRCRNGVCEVMK